MFKYEYNNDCGAYTVEFHGKWERFHYCKAAVMHLHEDGFGLHGEYVHEKWLMISYSTPILVIERMYNRINGEIIGYYIMWNEDMFRCSTSTIQQLSRFLNELNDRYGVSIHYVDLKQFEYHPVSPMERFGNVYNMAPVSNSEIEDYFSLETSYTDSPFWCYRG